MKYVRTGAIFLLSIIIWGCNGRPPEPTRIGVFADTGSLVELSLYARQIDQWIFQPPDQAQVPVSTRINSFFINLPDVTITESKIVWIGDLGSSIGDGKWEELPSQIEKTSGGVYKISSVALQSKAGGFAGLKVIMPLGTPDRIYLIKLQ